jgi:hypothetical protein
MGLRGEMGVRGATRGHDPLLPRKSLKSFILSSFLGDELFNLIKFPPNFGMFQIVLIHT